MKYKIIHMNCRKAARSWIIEIEARFPTPKQSTWENKAWTSEGMAIGNNLLFAIIEFWWLVRKEIKTRQGESGQGRETPSGCRNRLDRT